MREKLDKRMQMKTFKDLKFESHPVMLGLMSRMQFPNGYGVSVVRFKTMFGSFGSYTDNDNEWEVAILKNNDLCYTTPLGDDVIGHCSARKVTEIMKKVQKLK